MNSIRLEDFLYTRSETDKISFDQCRTDKHLKNGSDLHDRVFVFGADKREPGPNSGLHWRLLADNLFPRERYNGQGWY